MTPAALIGEAVFRFGAAGGSRVAAVDEVAEKVAKTTGKQYIVIGFEWDGDKAAANLRGHGVSFEEAAIACRDPFAVEWIDTRQVYREERSVLLGLCGREVLYVAYTGRGNNIRIISARRASKNEQDNYYRQNAP